jgi:hypothetical protein
MPGGSGCAFGVAEVAGKADTGGERPGGRGRVLVQLGGLRGQPELRGMQGIRLELWLGEVIGSMPICGWVWLRYTCKHLCHIRYNRQYNYLIYLQITCQRFPHKKPIHKHYFVK